MQPETNKAEINRAYKEQVLYEQSEEFKESQREALRDLAQGLLRRALSGSSEDRL